MIRDWWRRHFDGAVRADGLERCPCCGETFDARDLEQALVHFEHRLDLRAQQPEALPGHEELPASRENVVANVVPFRRRPEAAASPPKVAAAARGRPET